MQIVAVAKSLLPRSLDHAIVATSKNRSRNRIDDGDHVFPITRGTSAMEASLYGCPGIVTVSSCYGVTRLLFAR